MLSSFAKLNLAKWLIIDENGCVRSDRSQMKAAFACLSTCISRGPTDDRRRECWKVAMEMGRELARRFPGRSRLVVPVPDSGNSPLRFRHGTEHSLRSRFRP